ncbi:hypothetical protein KKE18_00185 [Patescibacteria group bacterium]|nr:hypothetical protein [Patescibacteria group bacterium]MBU0923086.1 hypothetical protein [Patescibacteria group bacterium]MBU1844895.1 hypothetical protein [Patescibacteria group bacterium]
MKSTRFAKHVIKILSKEHRGMTLYFFWGGFTILQILFVTLISTFFVWAVFYFVENNQGFYIAASLGVLLASITISPLLLAVTTEKTELERLLVRGKELWKEKTLAMLNNKNPIFNKFMSAPYWKVALLSVLVYYLFPSDNNITEWFVVTLSFFMATTAIILLLARLVLFLKFRGSLKKTLGDPVLEG